MPTYQYQCTACGEGLEAVQKFTDEALTECPSCQGRLRKVFSAVGVVFKGSGFYRNDSRGSSAGGSPAKPAAAAGKGGSGSSSPDATKSSDATKSAGTTSTPTSSSGSSSASSPAA